MKSKGKELYAAVARHMSSLGMKSTDLFGLAIQIGECYATPLGGSAGGRMRAITRIPRAASLPCVNRRIPRRVTSLGA